MDIYVDDTEERLHRFGFGFTGALMPSPKDGLVKLLEVDSDRWFVREERGFLICRPLEGKGDYEGYIRDCMKYYGVGSSSIGCL